MWKCISPCADKILFPERKNLIALPYWHSIPDMIRCFPARESAVSESSGFPAVRPEGSPRSLRRRTRRFLRFCVFLRIVRECMRIRNREATRRAQDLQTPSLLRKGAVLPGNILRFHRFSVSAWFAWDGPFMQGRRRVPHRRSIPALIIRSERQA